jgi:serine/threonine protein phosphatase 1
MIWNWRQTSSAPDGQRIYAIGDIHGRLDLLDQLMRMIVTDDQERGPIRRRTLVFLGDYIDRGADSSGVLERLLTGLPAGFECICLKGNHEEMLMQSLIDPGRMPVWTFNGGLETMASYGLAAGRKDVEVRPRDLAEALAAAIPNRHLAFLEGLVLSVTFGDYLFVHAGVHPALPLTAQRKEDCLFIREPFLSHRGSFGKIVVHGHTPVPQPEVKSNRIGIDTGGFFTGHLTALRLEGESRGFLST